MLFFLQKIFFKKYFLFHVQKNDLVNFLKDGMWVLQWGFWYDFVCSLYFNNFYKQKHVFECVLAPWIWNQSLRDGTAIPFVQHPFGSTRVGSTFGARIKFSALEHGKCLNSKRNPEKGWFESLRGSCGTRWDRRFSKQKHFFGNRKYCFKGILLFLHKIERHTTKGNLYFSMKLMQIWKIWTFNLITS